MRSTCRCTTRWSASTDGGCASSPRRCRYAVRRSGSKGLRGTPPMSLGSVPMLRGDDIEPEHAGLRLVFESRAESGSHEGPLSILGLPNLDDDPAFVRRARRMAEEPGRPLA